MGEKQLERKFTKVVKAAGGFPIKLLPFNLNGLPDRIALLPGGKLIFAEIKSPGKKSTKIQIYLQNKIQGLGFKVYVIDNQNDILQIIKDYERRVF